MPGDVKEECVNKEDEVDIDVTNQRMRLRMRNMSPTRRWRWSHLFINLSQFGMDSHIRYCISL